MASSFWFSMAKEYKLGQMEHNMMDYGMKDKCKDMDNSSTQIKMCMMVNLSKIRLMDGVNTHSSLVKFTKDTGLKTNHTVKESKS